MSEVLDQSDIDALLNAVEDTSGGEEDNSFQLFSRFRKDLENVEIKDYDFKRPERISKDQMRALRALHEAFARNFGAAMSGFLRTIVDVHVSSADQMTYSEFIDGLPNPTSFNLVNLPPLEGQMCLEISPLIVYPIIDRLLGGSSDDLVIPQRAMTAIEERLVEKILSRAMEALGEAWEGVCNATFTLSDMESNPQLVQIVPPNEVVVVIRFDLTMAKRTGTMSLCLPFNVIEPIIPELDAESWFSTGRNKGAQAWEEMISNQLEDVGVGISATLAETTITMDELKYLEVGDIITTSKPARDPVLFCVENIPKFFGKIGQFRGNRAIQIQRPVTIDDRI